MSEQRPILIIDLDETLIRINSFPVWVRYMMSGSFGRMPRALRLWLAFRVVAIMALRKIFHVPHACVKGYLALWWRAALEHDADGFAVLSLLAILRRAIRPQFTEILDAVSCGEVDAVLASAASDVYAVPFAQSLGFLHVLATVSPQGNGDFPLENIGEHKRDAVLRLCGEQGWAGRPLIVFTDHRDDMPLMNIADQVLWFGEGAAPVPAINALEMSALDMFERIKNLTF